MLIKWLGHACFQVITAGGRTIITDPYDEKVGYRVNFPAADIVTVSHQHFDHNAVHLVPGKPRVIDQPGEYQLEDIFIAGFSAYHDNSGGKKRGKNTIFVIAAEGVRLCHLGDLGHTLSDTEAALIKPVDVLLVPVGGTFTIGPAEAKAVVEVLQPRLVVPMHYRTPALQLPLLPVEEFLHFFPVHETKKVLRLTAGQLPAHQQVICLTLAV